MKYIPGFLLLSLVVAGCFLPATVGLKDIIANNGAFVRTGDIQAYEAVNLRNYDSEKGPVFVEFGVDSCLVAEFSRNNERYKTELYSFLNPRGAIGSYYFLDDGSFTPFDLGYFARKNDSAVHVVNGHYLIKVMTGRNGTINGALELAAGLTGRIDGGTFKPDIFNPLPKKNLVSGTEYYFSGYRAFGHHFSPALAQALNIRYAMNGVSGEYDVSGDRATLIKIRFPGRQDTIEAISIFLNTRRDRPILKSMNSLRYNTVIETDGSEVYIAEVGDILLFMMGGSKNSETLDFFEYLLRGGR